MKPTKMALMTMCVVLAGLLTGASVWAESNESTEPSESSESGCEQTNSQADFASPADPTCTREKTIESVTAGQHLRQPEAEQAWREHLAAEGELAVSPVVSEALPEAGLAVEGAKSQEPLVRQFSDDIWAKVGDRLTFQGESLGSERGPRGGPSKLKPVDMANADSELYTDTHLYVFVSESVPISTLKNYLTALGKVNVAFVLRGTVGDAPAQFMPTQVWAQRVLCKLRDTEELQEASDCEKGPVDINPNLFRALGIEEVPALVYVPNPMSLGTCGTNGTSEGEKVDALVWYGDMAPDYVLRRFIEARPDDMTLRELAARVPVTPGAAR